MYIKCDTQMGLKVRKGKGKMIYFNFQNKSFQTRKRDKGDILSI